MTRYYVGIRGDKIVMKGTITSEKYNFEDDKIEVSKEFYESIQLPSTFKKDEQGNIISVTPIPLPPEPQEPTEIEILQAENEALKQSVIETNAMVLELMETLLG